MIFVAQKSSEELCVSIKDIAEGTNAPAHFMAKIMQDLSKKKMVQSIKGPNGGFYIEKEKLSISLADIVTAIDGDGIYTDCVLGLKACSEKKPCPVHDEYKAIKKNLIRMLEKNTIGEFNAKLDTGKFFLKTI